MQFDDDGSLERRNLFGPAVDQILASEFIGSPNETNCYLADHLGSGCEWGTDAELFY